MSIVLFALFCVVAFLLIAFLGAGVLARRRAAGHAGSVDASAWYVGSGSDASCGSSDGGGSCDGGGDSD